LEVYPTLPKPSQTEAVIVGASTIRAAGIPVVR
jgi:hypothetical protein